MTRFLDRLASMPILLLSGGCGCCGTVMVPCDYSIPVHPMVHIAPAVHAKTHHVKRHIAHRGGRRGVMHALHAVATAARPTMCAIWLNEGTENVSLVDYDHAFGGGSDFGGGYGSGFGGDDEGGGFGGLGGESGGSDTIPDLFLLTLDTPPIVTPPDVTPSPPFSPPCCGPTPPVVVSVPETSTYLMMVMGLFGVGWLKWRRA